MHRHDSWNIPFTRSVKNRRRQKRKCVMYMNNIGVCLLQFSFQGMQTERIPHGAHRTSQRSSKTRLKDFITVPVKFTDGVAAVPKKRCLGTIGGILPAWRRRPIKIVDEKNFHNQHNARRLIHRWFTVHKPFLHDQSDPQCLVFF